MEKGLLVAAISSVAFLAIEVFVRSSSPAQTMSTNPHNACTFPVVKTIYSVSSDSYPLSLSFDAT